MTMPGETFEAVDKAAIRVVIANLPPVTHQLVARLIEGQQDMVMSGLPLQTGQAPIERAQDLLVGVGEGTDVLILGVERLAPMPNICSHLLGLFPFLKIVTLTPNGEAAKLYWLGLCQEQLGTLSAQTLVSAIREAYNMDPTVEGQAE